MMVTPMSHPNLHVLPFCAVLPLCAALLLSSCTEPADDAADENIGPQRIALPVQVMRAEAGSISEIIEVQARLRSTRQQDIVILTPGIVTALPVVEGQVVAEGEALLELAPLPADVDALAQAQTTLDRALRSQQRLLALQERVSGAVASADIDSAQDAVDDAQLALAKAQRDHANRSLSAPFTGVVDRIDATLGQRLESGRIFAQLQDITSFTTPIRVPETVVPRLRVGLQVDVLPLAGEGAQGEIITLPASIDRDSGSGTIQVRVDDPPAHWRPGAYALMRIHTRDIPGSVVLPRASVLYQRNRAYVWEVIADQPPPGAAEGTSEERAWVVRRAWLSLGAGDEDQVIIDDGLKLGALVVRDGTTGLSDQVPVIPQRW